MRVRPAMDWLGQPLAVDLADTVLVVRPGVEIDYLATEPDLERWVAAQRRRLPAARGLEGFVRLRAAIRALFFAAVEGRRLPASAVAEVNEASAAGARTEQLRARPTRPADIVEVPLSGDPTAAALGAIARSAIEILGGPDRERLRVCAAPSCGMFYLAGRPGQLWCSAPCGNRARVARHYARSRRRV